MAHLHGLGLLAEETLVGCACDSLEVLSDDLLLDRVGRGAAPPPAVRLHLGGRVEQLLGHQLVLLLQDEMQLGLGLTYLSIYLGLTLTLRDIDR